VPRKLNLTDLQQRFENIEPYLRAFIPEENRWSRIQQETPSTDLSLAGLTLAVKDIINIDGFESRCGSTLPPEVFAGRQASCVTRLIDNGATLIGKTITTEFAYYEPGPTTNPHNHGHTPGGSSSGSAAAVAAKLCDIALGSQTQGSVIRPAAFCGCVGFKPTFGRIPIDGVMPFSPSVDTLGIFTQNTATAKLAASVLLDDWQDAYHTMRLPTLAVPRGPYLDHVEPAALQSFENTLAKLSEQGFKIHNIDAMPDFEAMADRHRDLAAAEAAEVHKNWLPKYRDLYRPKSIAIIEKGLTISPDRLAECRASLTALRTHLDSLMANNSVDAWLCPSAPGIAPATLNSTGDPVMNIPWTHAHMPAITLPCNTIDGLPLGLQIAARYGYDEQLLTNARTIEAALQHKY
jgi:Asp-tRNA(Asn)/Glu-tRNA(Gln) amidotransferase A subunit family amidase